MGGSLVLLVEHQTLDRRISGSIPFACVAASFILGIDNLSPFPYFAYLDV